MVQGFNPLKSLNFLNIKMAKINCYACKRSYGFINPECNICNGLGKIDNPKHIKCNLCSGSLCPDVDNGNSDIPHGLYKAKVSGGYDSYHLFDMTCYTFNFCEKCLRELFNKCKIPPVVEDLHDGKRPYKEDKKYYDYMLWLDSGGGKEAYKKGKCNFVKNCRYKAKYSQFISGYFTEKCCCEKHKNLFNYSNSELKKFIPNNLKIFL